VVDHLNSALDHFPRLDMVDDVGARPRVVRLGGGNVNQTDPDPGVFGSRFREGMPRRDSRQEKPGYHAQRQETTHGADQATDVVTVPL
jgi:hypothetical protein